MNSTASRFATLMGSVSFLTLTAAAAHAQGATPTQVAQAAETVPEQVLVTGSLIRGAAAVGVPVTNLGPQDLTQSGAINVADLFRTVPAFTVSLATASVSSGGQLGRQTQLNLRGLSGMRSLMMIDGVRYPLQGEGTGVLDPSIIPALALDRLDVLPDGASAIYGSDAMAGVINLILRRGYDGIVTMVHYDQPDKGGQQVQASGLWGRTWDGGDVTLTYEFNNTNPTLGTAHSNFTVNYTPWGLDNQIPLASSIPGTISTGAPANATNKLSATVGTNCTNCWIVPRGTGQNFNAALNSGLGPTAASSAATLNWATLIANAANNGVNEADSPKLGYEYAAEQRNSFVATFDQRLMPGISVFGTGFDSVRRTSNLLPPFYSTSVTSDIQTFSVPTTNPYYPTNAPSTLRVSYDLGQEVPLRAPVVESSYRYQFGVNLELPYDWSGQVYYSRSSENIRWSIDMVNDNAANVALGTPVTVNGVTYTKPASVPYLNLFCDATAFQCNSPVTLAYITGQRAQGTSTLLSERNAHFDGPLFDLPGGQAKLAVGGVYESDDVDGYQGNNAANTAPGQVFSAPHDRIAWNIWAEFAQLNIPVFGDNFNIPLVRKFDLEVSFRHDAYDGSLSGSTSNPKVAFNWLIDDRLGATVRGSWGSSFRFANPGEFSPIIADNNQAFNLPGVSQVTLPCSGGAPTSGSVSADLFAAAFACNSAPGGVLWGGGIHRDLRTYINASSGLTTTRQGGPSLAPENGLNYSGGIEFAPTIDLLKGLDIQTTWYSVKVRNAINSFASVTQSVLADPTMRFHFIMPSDVGCPVAANKNPTSCAPFEKMVLSALTDSNSPISASQIANIYWISDASRANSGFLRVTGIDWSASYDLDAGDWGAWNTGITGSYYLHSFQQTVNGGPITDGFHQNIGAAAGIAQNGVTTSPRMSYRARLGWSDGVYSVTGFMNYSSHYYQGYGTPTNVNNQCSVAGGTVGGGTFPCAINNYTNLQPSFYTFDLSFGYNTGDRPTNDYLKGIAVQLTVRNLTNRHSPFEYAPNTSSRNPSAYDNQRLNSGRIVGLTLIKNW